MPTFKAIVEPHYKRQDGTYNIKIRVTHNRQKRYMATKHYARPADLTRTLKIKEQDFIDATDDLIRKYRKICDAYKGDISKIDIDEVVKMLKDGYVPGEVFRLDFFEYGERVITKLREEGKAGTAGNYQIALNALTRYTGRTKLDISEITGRFIEGFIEWIRKRPAPGKRAKGKRAESLYPGIVRAIHNNAKKEYNEEDRGIIRIPYSPFSTVSLPAQPQTKKRALPVEEIRAIAALPDKKIIQAGTNRYNLARDVFMLSFLLVGMNTVDLFCCDEYKDGRITYKRKKTRTRRQDEALFSVKVEPEAIPLVEKYRDPTGQRVFRFFHLYATPDTFNAAVNKGLKVIGSGLKIEDLEHGAARHSVGTIARNKCGVSKDDVDLMLNHVSLKNKTADIYIDIDWSIVDKAQRKVINYFNGPKPAKGKPEKK